MKFALKDWPEAAVTWDRCDTCGGGYPPTSVATKFLRVPPKNRGYPSRAEKNSLGGRSLESHRACKFKTGN